jgi:RNA polymerase sigma-70 factor (ECF subfamily)
MVGDQDAEDVAQEALIEVCKSIGRFKGNSSLHTWVYRVSTNVCLEHRRRRKPEIISFEDDFAEREVDPNDNPEAAVIRGELKSDINKALQALSEIHRDVVVLHELQGLTYQECAEVLDCPVGTVKSRLSSAFIKLRQLLGEHATESDLVR